jgi:hypothetical protein
MRTRNATALWPVLTAAIVLASTCACRESVERKVMEQVAQSHVDANVPQPGDFDRFMRRDLQSYLESAGYKPVLIHYELLRDGPTQVGSAYPKFYVWMQADTGDSAFTEGVARLAAVDKKEFQVTDFILMSDLRQNPGRACDVFPGPVCLEIQERIREAGLQAVSGR